MSMQLGVAGVHAPAFVERGSRPSSPASAVGVAGVHAPAFVERCAVVFALKSLIWRVAGVHAPAFVERTFATRMATKAGVSPGFTPRPSLSVPGHGDRGHRQRVAGVHAPAFVERRRQGRARGRSARVSPGFTPRPSLSACTDDHPVRRLDVSPGFTPRPSLSGGAAGDRGVVGGHQVSPGFTPRPSLSVLDAVRQRPGQRVSPGFTPRPSLSALAPSVTPTTVRTCRRGSRPGLR